MDYEVDLSGNKRLVLMRFINGAAENIGNSWIYITPTILWHKYGINLDTINSVLTYLKQHGHINIDEEPNHDLTPERRARLEDEQDAYIISLNDSFHGYYKALEETAAFHNADRDFVEQPGLRAKLELKSISIPTVIVGPHSYELSGMNEGIPFNIISYCLEYRPNQTLTIDELRNELKAKGMSAAGITNIREQLRKSLFGDTNELGIFVTVSSKAIEVRPTALLTDTQLQAIINACKKSY